MWENFNDDFNFNLIIKIKSDDDLHSEQIQHIHNVVILIKSAFNKNYNRNLVLKNIHMNDTLKRYIMMYWC